MFTNLTVNSDELEQTDIGISSLTDTWILCRDQELNGERNRCVYVLKSRGMAHSNQIREFVMSREGIRLVPPYIGSGVVLTGSSRVAQEAKEKAEALVRSQEIEQRQEALERKRSALEAQIKVLKMDFAAEELELERIIRQQQSREKQLELERDAMNRIRVGTPEQTIGFGNGKRCGRRKVKKKAKANGKFTDGSRTCDEAPFVRGGADSQVHWRLCRISSGFAPSIWTGSMSWK